MIHFDDATKQQLLQIALWEECPLEYKYEAALELQMRQWHDDYLPALIKLWGEGLTSFQIAIELGVEQNVVAWQLEKHDLYGRKMSNGLKRTCSI